MEAEVPPEVGQEVEEALVIEDEGVLGEEGEEEEEEEELASVLGEGVEGVILISQGLALVVEDHELSGLALRRKAFCVWENTSGPFNSTPSVEETCRQSSCPSTLLLKSTSRGDHVSKASAC